MSETISKLNELPFPTLEKRLTNNIRDVLTCLEWQTFPTREMCLETKDILRAYMNAPKPSPYSVLEQSTGLHMHIESYDGEIPGRRILLETVGQIENGWELLFRLGLEKLCSADDDCFQTSGGRQLITEHYVVPVTITIGTQEHCFYTLSEKGWACHRARKAHTSAKNSGAALLQQVPKGILLDNAFWNPLTAIRAMLLRDFFAKESPPEPFLLFSHPAAAELLLGCSVSDHTEVEYACTCIFNGLPSAAELQAIKDTAQSPSVDLLNLLFLNVADADTIRDDLPAELVTGDKVQFHIMEVSNG